MPLVMQLLGTYMVVSFFVGLGLMVFDAATGFKKVPAGLVVVLYLPPLGLLTFGLLIAVLSAIWR